MGSATSNSYLFLYLFLFIKLIPCLQFVLCLRFLQNFKDEDVFVCESRYNVKTKSFKKIKVEF